jgi:TPR repeat protein
MNKKGSDDIRYVLGKLMIEGTSDKVSKNEKKGLNWLKEACKKGHLPSIEFKTYWDIRFDREPKLDKIKEALENAIKVTNSTRACNTLAELNHAASGGSAESLSHLTAEAKVAAEAAKGIAANYYMVSAELGDIIGMHWIGVFYHEGFGVSKNIDKAIDFLTRASCAGNA